MTIQLAFICGVCIIFISGINGWLSIIDMYGHWYKHKNINDMVVHQSSLLRSLLLILVRNKIDTTYFEQDACSGVHTGLIMRVLVCNSRTVWITLTCMMFVMLLWVCIHTGRAEKLIAGPRWESHQHTQILTCIFMPG